MPRTRFSSPCVGLRVVPAKQDGTPMVAVDIEIECAVCGHHHVLLAPQHLRAIGNMLLELFDEYPAILELPDDHRTH